MRSAWRIVDSRWAMTIEVRPSRAASSARCTATSDSESRWAVASSSTTTSGALSSRRAMASRCFSPPLSRWPRSPTTVSRPSGSSSTSALIWAARRAAWISSSVASGVEQVGADRVVEEVRLLGDHTDTVAQRRHRHVPQVDPTDAHGALARVVEPGHEGGQRRLAGARGSDEGDEVTGRRRDGDVVEHLPAAATVTRGDRLERGERDLVGRRVAERHVLELDAERTVGQGDGAGALLDERLEVEHLEDALEGDERRHDVDAHVGQGRQRAVETGQQGGWMVSYGSGRSGCVGFLGPDSCCVYT